MGWRHWRLPGAMESCSAPIPRDLEPFLFPAPTSPMSSGMQAVGRKLFPICFPQIGGGNQEEYMG